ncbi:hypothetical protein E4V99_03585 [Microbacterium sp. dk485]|uniref:BadF/BadG/BcrA/BcrD ATPase family protein n=1 Tax=Microbacterium sp. dk485 TaxID=2560021 RepID=UPI0010746B13|nr:BadF/BadG/BcrA/BcrD ATPase family protein [Microbacterium sp. dk485]TFV84163.1 hypothetical protein E4V99_03585 [Microbacterium sp. dk485]
MTSVGAFVDIGKSQTRLHALGSGQIRTHSAEGISPSEKGDHGRIIAETIGRLLAEAGAESATHLLIGSTSELSAPEVESLFHELRVRIPEAVIGLTDDGTLSHARALNAPGVVLAVGTGVIAVARTADGGVSRFDGWGPLAGDRGSAVQVGRWALRAAYRAVDEARHSPLRRAVEQMLGELTPYVARAVVADERWPATLAGFAVQVCDAADHGDAEAGAILDDAVDELIRTARMSVTAAGAGDVVVTGRFGEAPALRTRLALRFADEDMRLSAPLPPDAVGIEEILSGPYASSITFAWDDRRTASRGGY